MASTYVNDLRLNEMATGDASGTWGTTTNTNLELIGEAFSFGTEAITTNADTHATTIADGATDPGRSMYLKYTGTLDSACTITIGPNTISKMWFIENATSGSQNIIISQGSGANITIPAGDTKAVYSDGAGSGAAFVDAFASLSVVDLKVQDDLTVIDDVIIGGALGVTGVLTGSSLDISGNIDIDGTTNLDVVDIDGAVNMATTLLVTGNVDFNGDLDVDGTTNLDVVDIDGAVDMASTLTVAGVLTGASLDISGNIDVDGTTNLDVVDIDGAVDMASTLAVAGVLTANAGVVVDNFTLDGTTLALSSGDLTVDVAGTISLDADGGDILFKDGGTEFGRLYNSSSDFAIFSAVADKDMKFQGNDSDGGGVITALTLDMSAAGLATFNAGITATSLRLGNTGSFGDVSGNDLVIGNNSGSHGLTIHSAAANTSSIFFGNDGTNGNIDGSIQYHHESFGTVALRRTLEFKTARVSRMVINSSGNVGIGTASPAYTLDVNGNIGVGTTSSGQSLIQMLANPTNGANTIHFGDGASAAAFVGYINYAHDSNSLQFAANGAERMRIDSSGNVGIGTSAPTDPLTIHNGTPSIAFKDTSSNGEFFMSLDGIDLKFFNKSSNGPIYFGTANTERMRILGNGDVLIGQTSQTGYTFAEKLVVGDGDNNDGITIQSGGTHQGNLAFNHSDGTTAHGRISYQHGTNFMAFFANNSEKMRIASNGRTSIGTTTTNAGLTVASGDIRTTAAAVANDANSISMSQESSGGFIVARGPSTSERGTISLSVNMENGSSGLAALKVENNAHITLNDVTRLQQGAASNKGTSGGVGGFELNIDSNAPRMNWYNDAGATRSVQYFYYEGTERGSIQVLAGSTSYLTSSDYRLKENVDYTWDATTRLKQLKPARFNFTNDAGNTVDGFLAHEVSSIVPDAISGTKDEVDSDGNAKYQGIDHSKLVPLLVKTIQELEARITALES